MSNFKIKGIDKNAVTVNIGKIVTKPTFQSWFISVDFEPPQDKKTIPFAHVTHLVEGRALAATNAEHSSPDTASDVYEMEFTDVDPIVQPQSKKQHSRSVFVYKNGKTFIGIPMLELARALFFHNSYLSEAALSTSNTLDLEFDCQLEKNGHLAHIYALPHCRFPLALYEQEASRTHLSWILLDKNARTSFESIFKNLQEQKEYKKDWLSWYFRFNPPNLKGARIKLLGKLDPKLNTFVAKEIKSITNIPVNMPRQVKFYHPKFTRTADEKETEFRHLGQLPQVDIEIDTSLIATSVDKSIKLIDVPPASIGFATLFSTFKIAENIVDPKITIPKDSEEAATETETGGTAENIVTGEDRKFDWNSTTDLTDKS